MTLLETLETTNSTLHDAELLSLTVDYRRRTLRFELDVWAGGTSELESERETYQLATLLVTGLEYFVSQAPLSSSPLERPSSIDGFTTRQADIDDCKLPDIPENAYRYSFFLFDWNSSMHFAATGAELIRFGPLTEGPSRLEIAGA